MDIGTLIDIAIGVAGLGLCVGGYYWHGSIKATVRENAGTRAMAQIDAMATNHFPHMEQSLKDLVVSHGEMNGKLDKQTELLQDINTGIKVLVDRGTRL